MNTEPQANALFEEKVANYANYSNAFDVSIIDILAHAAVKGAEVVILSHASEGFTRYETREADVLEVIEFNSVSVNGLAVAAVRRFNDEANESLLSRMPIKGSGCVIVKMMELSYDITTEPCAEGVKAKIELHYEAADWIGASI